MVTGSHLTARRMVEKTIELLSVVISVRISTQQRRQDPCKCQAVGTKPPTQETLRSRKTFSIKDALFWPAKCNPFYNRRSDIEVQPADVETTRFYPHQAKDADVLMQAGWPNLRKVIDADQTSTVVAESGAQQ